MPVKPSGMTLDAKIRHHVSKQINRSDAAAVKGPSLFDPVRAIIIERVYAETAEIHTTAAGVYKIGTLTDTDAYGTMTIPTSGDALGDMVAAASFSRTRVPANTPIVFDNTQSANAGEAWVHVWWHYEDYSAAIEAA